MQIEQLIKENKGTIIDVRSRVEFMGGHVSNSINIPLQEITSRVEELKKFSLPLILCCASGNRSGQAQSYLMQQGFDCINGGSWLDINYYQTNE